MKNLSITSKRSTIKGTDHPKISPSRHSSCRWVRFFIRIDLEKIHGLFLIDTAFFPSEDVNWWTGIVWITCELLWCFWQLFGLWFWRHPFTAEDPLVSKWCNAKVFQISDEEKLIYILDGLSVSKFSTYYNFLGKPFFSPQVVGRNG